jgi:glyoxylase-like metal-dependent hydrolase (beta-lactamase superfamily II)
MSGGALVPVGANAFAWLASTPGLDRPNAGVVVDDDGATVIDTLMVPSQTEDFASALDELGVPVRRVVLTSSHVPFVGGSTRFRLAALYGTAQISAHLDQPPNVAGYQRLFPADAAEFEHIGSRPVSHLVTEAAWLTPSAVAVPTTGQIAENLVVQVPAANVVFAGAMGAFGVRPLAFDGDPARWADALDDIRGWGAVIVPGSGAIGGAEELDALQRYLRACVAAHGDPGALGPGPWDTWAHPEFDAVNVERAAMLARGDRSPPPSMLRLLGMG